MNPVDYMKVGTDLITSLTYNVYDKPHYIIWEDPKKAQTACSSFVTLLLSHVYNWKLDKSSPFKKYMNTISPFSDDYNNHINNVSTMFTKVNDVLDTKIGDIIAVNYFKLINNSTGHTMLVNSVPELITPKSPLVPNTKQYKVQVLDSTRTSHGSSNDTRTEKQGGIGLGYIRIYTDSKTNKIVGYGWSLATNTDYYSIKERNIVVGRLNYDLLRKDGFLN